jgi:hypothetical protein
MYEEPIIITHEEERNLGGQILTNFFVQRKEKVLNGVGM